MANLTVGGVDLYAVFGLDCPEITGMLAMQGAETAQTPIPGRRKVNTVILRRNLEPFTVAMVLTDLDRAAFLTKLADLKSVLSPDNGYVAVTRTDVPGKRIMARCMGFPLDETVIPFILRGGKFQASFEPLGPWEDANAISVTDPASIVNGGDFAVYPTYTCTAGASLASGLDFTIGTKQFAWNGALVNTDVVVVNADTCVVTKNGTVNYADVDSGSLFPELAVGTNAVSKSAGTWTLNISYRQQYE